MAYVAGTETRPAPADELTARQHQLHRYMLDYQRRHGMPPTVREIGEHFEIRSPNGVMCHLKALRVKGWVVGEGVISRGRRAIDVTAMRKAESNANSPGCCPTCGRPIEGTESQEVASDGQDQA